MKDNKRVKLLRSLNRIVHRVHSDRFSNIDNLGEFIADELTDAEIKVRWNVWNERFE